MVKKLKIEGMEINYEPIKANYRTPPHCDSKGKKLNREKVIEIDGEEYRKNDYNAHYKYFYTEGEKKGEKHTGNTYRLIDGEPKQENGKTKQVNKYKKVNKTEAQDLKTHNLYAVKQIPNKLKQEIGEDKALKFIYNTSSIREYYAYLYQYQNKWIMKIGKAIISQKLNEIEETETEPETDIEEPEVEKAKQELTL